MWKDARENLDFSNSFCLIVLNQFFKPKPCVKEELTCSEHDPISSKFIEEYHFFGPSSCRLSVLNQFSHHEWESGRQKKRISTKSPTFPLTLCFCEQLHFRPVFSTTTPFVFLLPYLIPVNYFLFSPFLCYSLSFFKPAKYLCFLLLAPWGLFHKGKT